MEGSATELKMNAQIVPPNGLSLPEVVEKLHGLSGGRPDGPTAEQLKQVCDILYSSSLLKEEGRTVRARVIIAPPEDFDPESGPPEGVHAVKFSLSHALTANEIKRLCPAASFFHSVVAVWPDPKKGLRIWGVLNTGPRWLNHVAGGRKSAGEQIRHPVIQVRDPGWLLFFHGHNLVAEWRGQDFHGPRLDVFRSKLLGERFLAHRRRLVGELVEECLPCSLGLDVYADLTALVSQQFVKRIINLVRTSGHGGSLIFLPDDAEGMEVATRWIDCKYTAVPDRAGHRFGTLLQAIIRRVGELCDPGAGVEEAWDVFRNSTDRELDRLEEAFFELARLFSDFMQVDGALVLDKRVRLIGFGGEIRVDHNVLKVGQAMDLEASEIIPWNVQNDGTRHRSVYRLCSVEPEAIGFVISQDNHVRLIANVDDSVVFWSHSMV